MHRIFAVILSFVFIFISTGYADEEDGIQMIMPEGQLISQPIEVFINQNINESMNPKLKIIVISLIQLTHKEREHEFKPMVIARNQTKIINNIAYKGTKLMFFLNRDIFLRSYSIMKQVKPVLVWENSEQTYEAVGNSMNIGNDIPFVLYILATIACCVIVIAVWSKRAEKSAWDLLLGNDGYLSLSRTQVAAWTIVVGGIVFAFGLLMLKVPEIPKSLLALMGFSLATGGLKYYAGDSKESKKNKASKFSLSDLICEGNPETNKTKTSLPKAQMLFWTVLMLFLFVVKSIADGVLWEVPWEMVALMGMSQAAYLSPHLISVNKSGETPSDDNSEQESGNEPMSDRRK